MDSFSKEYVQIEIEGNGENKQGYVLVDQFQSQLTEERDPYDEMNNTNYKTKLECKHEGLTDLNNTNTIQSIENIDHNSLGQSKKLDQNNLTEDKQTQNKSENFDLKIKNEASKNKEDNNTKNQFQDNNDTIEQEVFSKHYIEPKKARKDLKVKIASKVQVKPQTVVNTLEMSTLERDEHEISNCETEEEISKIAKRLIKELEELQERKKKGYDIYQQYQDLQYKFDLAKEAKLRIKIKKESEQASKNKPVSISNDNQNIVVNKPQNYQVNVSKTKLNTDNFEHKLTKVPNELNENVFNYLNDYNSYQFLLVFYNCSSVFTNQFQCYLNKIFDRFNDKDLKVALYKNCGTQMIYTHFHKAQSGHNMYDNKQFNSLLELQNEISKLEWSHHRIKFVCFITDEKSRKAEIDIMMKFGGATSYLENNKIHQTSYEFCIKYPGPIQDFDDFIKSDFLLKVMEERKHKWFMEQLALLKRCSFKTLEDLNEFKNGIKNNENWKLNPQTTRLELKSIVKTFYTDNVSLETLNDIDTYQIDISNKTNELFEYQNVQLQEAYYFGPSKLTFWFEKLRDEKVILSMIDISSTVSYFVELFNIALTEYSCMLKVSKNYFVSYESGSNDTFFANETNSSIENAKIGVQNDYKDLFNALMHFSYKQTQGRLVVFDVRTLENSRQEILLTEPIVFSVDSSRYGPSNLGELGINYLMSKHRCGSFCTIFAFNDQLNAQNV